MDNSIKNISLESQYSFSRKCDKFFNNIVFLASILELDKETVSNFSKSLLNYLKHDEIKLSGGRAYLSQKYVYGFFIRQQNHISLATLKQLLLLSFKYMEFYNEIYNNDICWKVIKSNLKIRFTVLEFKNIILPFIVGKLADRTFSNYGDNVFYLFRVLNSENQRTIKKLYLDNLNIKFDYNLFSSLVLYDLINIEQGDYLNIFINDIDIPNERVANRTIFQNPSFNRYSKIDDLINICFKCGINLNNKRFSKFKKVNNYYEWLFNIDGYDYKNFDPFWINQYDTI